MKPTGKDVAAAAVQAVSVGYTYDEMDCQAFVEHCVRQAGGSMDYLGCNDMARRAVWLGTLADARTQGRLVPGAGVLIREETEANLPARYAGDGLGDFSHVGLYVGTDALTDTDKNGRKRSCDVVHSSNTMDRVAGSTLANGWTHVMWFSEIDYGAADRDAAPSGLTAGAPAANTKHYAVVVTSDGGPVRLRKSASEQEPMYWLVNNAARVLVERERDGWALVTAICTDGYTRRAYIMSQFLHDD